MTLDLKCSLTCMITRGAFRQGNAAGGGYEAYEETLCNLTYGDRSWIACGKERVDLARACEILASAFGVERMAVVGGGHIHHAASGGGQLLLCAAASGASPSETRNIASLFKKGFALFKQIGLRSAPRAKCFLRRVRREKFSARSEVYFCVHGTQKYAQRSENARPKGQCPLGRSVFRRGTGTRRSAGHFRR